MFSPRLRVVLALMGAVAAALALLGGRWLLGSAYLVAAYLFVHGQWRYGTVWLALRAFRRGDMRRVAELLHAVRRPERLDARHRAYHDWMKGVLAADSGDLEQARTLLTRAVEGAIRTDHDRAIAHYHLAEIATLQNDATGAHEHLAEAGRLTRDRQLLDLISAQEQKLAGA